MRSTDPGQASHGLQALKHPLFPCAVAELGDWLLFILPGDKKAAESAVAVRLAGDSRSNLRGRLERQRRAGQCGCDKLFFLPFLPLFQSTACHASTQSSAMLVSGKTLGSCRWACVWKRRHRSQRSGTAECHRQSQKLSGSPGVQNPSPEQFGEEL